MFKKIAVLGSGGTGSVIGGLLEKGGCDVTIIDQWPAHVEAMKHNGLEVAVREEVFQIPVKAYHICEVATLHHEFDLIFLACKSYDSLWMVQLIQPYLKSNGVLVSAQNSLNDEWIAPLIGYTRDIGCVLTMSSEVFKPGRVSRNTPMDQITFTIGELHGRITPRLKSIQEILNLVGKTEVTTNILGRKWAKTVFNSMVGPLCGVGGVRPHQLTETPERLRVGLKLGQESIQVGLAHGYYMDEVFGELNMVEAFTTTEILKQMLIKAIAKEGKPTCSFYHQDALKGRRTEVDYINGLVSRKGREAGVPTPMNDVTTEMVHRLERGEIKPDPANIKELEKHL